MALVNSLNYKYYYLYFCNTDKDVDYMWKDTITDHLIEKRSLFKQSSGWFNGAVGYILWL